MNLQNKAFTLVELIVVITILAILGTIAFISLQGYSATSRDSVRISDISKIKSGLELFHIGAGKYPETTGGYAVTFTGVTIREQGTFGDVTAQSVDKLDKIPLDPLTGKEYTYSRLNTKQEYEIAGLFEGDDLVFVEESVAAGEKTATAYVTGHYNGKIAKVNDGSRTYVLAVPTIISGERIDLETIFTNGSFVYSGYENLPFSYSGSSYKTDGDSDKTFVSTSPSDYIVFSGSLSDLTNPDDASYRVAMLQGLQDAYTGSVIADSVISEIMDIVTFDPNDSIISNLAGTVVNNTLGASVTVSSSSSSSGGGLPVCKFDDAVSKFGDGTTNYCVFG